MARRHFVSPDSWFTTPIQRPINPLTGKILGDDDGYRNIATLLDNLSPLVVPQVLIRASYDGMNEYGIKDDSIRLGGGLRNGALVLREIVARGLEVANKAIKKLSGDGLEICALDGYRSRRRQAAGFRRMLYVHLSRRGLSRDKLTDRVGDLLESGTLADGTFSWVNPKRVSRQYVTAFRAVQANARLMEQLKDFVAKNGDVSEQRLDDAIDTYLTIGTNAGLPDVMQFNIELDCENNAHAGGGAVDFFVVDRQGRPVNIVPFDYPGPEAAIDFMEKEGNYALYLQKAASDPVLGAHLAQLGYKKPEDFIPAHWNKFRDVLRLVYHLSQAMGWTFYSGIECGENWHFEPGNVVYCPFTGEVLYSEVLTANQFPDSGNPGHALQTNGRNSTAVWGGASGAAAAQDFGFAQ